MSVDKVKGKEEISQYIRSFCRIHNGTSFDTGVKVRSGVIRSYLMHLPKKMDSPSILVSVDIQKERFQVEKFLLLSIKVSFRGFCIFLS